MAQLLLEKIYNLMKDLKMKLTSITKGIGILFTLFFCVLILKSCQNNSGLIASVEEFNKATADVKPGDKFILANGIWKNAELKLKGDGTPDQPIILSVETKGGVTLEGQSSISISGKHIVLEGLVFKNGYTPSSEVISFRTSKKDLCNNCRVTECVIDNYNNPERFESDYWVGIYGKDNRFDHNYLTGKRNQGVTLAVRMNTEASRENNNRIDHNYFGHRPVLGSNGGETLRIGTSHYSMSNSNTLVEVNYFDRCNGEHEIISNKACQSVFRNNTFFECQGTLTMRHGNETLVENNYFFGNRKANTGGVRIINETQTVMNNYCEGLTGYRFRGALVIMNGVPNSPLNRYFQVIDSEASNNTFIDCDHIQLCAGSDSERSATPQNTKVFNNLFYSKNKKNVFTVYDDISGIEFKNNVLSENMEPFQKNGFLKEYIDLVRNENGLLLPKSLETKDIGMTVVGEIATPKNTGVNWYPRNEETIVFNSGKIIKVEPGVNTLGKAVNTSKAGDIIELQAGGQYISSKAIDVTHPLTIKADGKNKPVMKFRRTSLFNIENGGSLNLSNLTFEGEECDDKPNNTVIRTSRYSMSRNYKLLIDNCDVNNLDVNHSFSFLKIYKNTFADSISITNTSFNNVTGHILSLDKETDDIGIYNVENVVLNNCSFKDIGGTVLNLHRGGRDESTFGPILEMNKCRLINVGKDKRNKSRSSVNLHGVQYAEIMDCDFGNSRPLKIHLVVGEPVTKMKNCKFEKTEKIVTNDGSYDKDIIQYLN